MNDRTVGILVVGVMLYFLLQEDEKGEFENYSLTLPKPPFTPTKNKRLTQSESVRANRLATKLTEVLTTTYYIDASDRCEAYKAATLETDRVLAQTIYTFAKKNKNFSIPQMIRKTAVNGCKAYNIQWDELLIKRIENLMKQFDVKGNWIGMTSSLKNQANADILQIKKIVDAFIPPDTCDFRRFLLYRTDEQIIYISQEYKRKYGSSKDAFLTLKTESSCVLHSANLVDLLLERLRTIVYDNSDPAAN